jgi:hypothetical protein
MPTSVDIIQFNILMEIAQYIGMIQLTLKSTLKESFNLELFA